MQDNQSEFQKTQAQKKALVTMATSQATDVMLMGGARAGKTFIAVYALAVRCLRVRSSALIVRATFNSVKNSIWMATLPTVFRMAFPEVPLKWDRTNYILTLPNLSTIKCAGLDDGDKLERLLGLEFSTLLIEECNQVPWNAVQKLKTRLAEKNDLVKKTLYTQNPTVKTSAYYFAFEKLLDPMDNEPFEPEEAKEYLSIKLNPRDNLENIDSNFIKMLERLPEKERLRFLDGEYQDQSDGQVYYAFSPDIHVKPVKQTNGTIFIGMDFNVSPMTAILCQVVDNKLQVFDEVYLENGDTPMMINELKKRGYTGLQVIPDSTANNRKTSGVSDVILLRQAGFQVLPTYNPFVVDRVNNVNLRLTNEEVVIDPRCKKLINDLQKVVWKDNKLDQSGANKHLTHVSDCLGYALHKLMPLNTLINNKAEMRRRL